LQEKSFCGIDAPVCKYFPEWNQGIKKEVTIRQLLSHTSGMQEDETGASCYDMQSILQFALTTDFASYPGCSFKYNNKGTNLLAGVLNRVTGMTAQEYLRGRLFSPLGISSDTWLCDPSGNLYGMSHLSISALDLAKIGMLIAQDGSWYGYNYLPKAWVDYMKTPSQTFTPFYGALVWLGYMTLDLYWDQPLLNSYRACGVPEAYVAALESMNGRVLKLQGHINYSNFQQYCAVELVPIFGSCEAVYDFFQLVESAGLPIASWNEGHLRTVAARGYLGQQLIIFPDEQLIGVRLSSTCGPREGADTFADFESLLVELLYQMGLDNACAASIAE
jgi:CubicO group peptidase (beta-lactamase class C family)